MLLFGQSTNLAARGLVKRSVCGFVWKNVDVCCVRLEHDECRRLGVVIQNATENRNRKTQRLLDESTLKLFLHGFALCLIQTTWLPDSPGTQGDSQLTDLEQRLPGVGG